MSRSLARSISAHWAGTAINVGVTLLLTPFIVRSLGTENYGLLVLCTSLAGHVAILDFGMRYALVKYVAECRATGRTADIAQLLSSCIAALFAPALLVIGFVLFGQELFQSAFSIPLDREHKVQLLLFIYITDGVLELFSGAFSSALGGCERYDQINVLNSVRLMLYAAGVGCAIAFGGGVLSIALIYLVTRVLQRTAIAVLFFKNLPGVRIAISRVKLSSVWTVTRYSSWAFLIVLAERVINQSQPWIIGTLQSKVGIAVFALGAMLVEQVRQLGLQASVVLSTRLSACLALKNTSMSEALLERWFTYTPVLAGLFAVPFIISGRDFIALWVGSTVAAEADYLWLMSLALPFVLPAFGFSAVLFASSQHRAVAIVQILEAAISLALSIVLVEPLGLRGVAFAYVTSGVLCSGILLPLCASRLIGFHMKRYLRLVSSGLGTAILPYAAVLIFLRSIWNVDTWFHFLGLHSIAAGVLITLTYLYVLKSEDWPYLRRRVTILGRVSDAPK